RSMFWWGNFYSYSLFLQGEPLEKLKHFLKVADMGNDENLYISAGKKLWEYDFTEENYLPAKNLSASQIQELIHKDFLKLSYKFPVTITEEEIITNGLESFEKIMR